MRAFLRRQLFGPVLVWGAVLLVSSGGLWGAYSWAWNRGHAAAEADHAEAARAAQARIDAANARIRDLSRDMLARQAEITTLQRRLADDALDDPDADRPALGAGSVQRLDQIR